MWFQKEIVLPAKSRGFHLVTDEILKQVPEIKRFSVGLAHFFIKHSSASLTINENADSDVRVDMEQYFNRLAPENESYFRHVLEGPDDMPAHLKTVLLGVDLTLPVQQGRLSLGVWQGIYLGEHRDRAAKRRIVVTLSGVENH